MLSSTSTDQLSGLVGIAYRVLDALGEVGVGLLTLVETVFPPIPSEVILPLAGFLSQQEDMSFVLVLITSTLGAYLGALVLYWLGRRLGQERVINALSVIPLLDRRDFERAAGWFARHGRRSIFFGRLIPGVRSLISLPAGAARMPVHIFSLFTLAGTLVWNTVLVSLGRLLGTQYKLVDKYSQWVDYAIYAAVAVLIGWLIWRRVKRKREAELSD